MKPVQNNLAARFLLGKLTEEENIKIEKEFFGEINHFENILIAENDLIDAYVKGDLPPEDKIRFESRLLLNPKQRQRLEFAQSLIKYASAAPATDLIVAPSKPKWSSIIAQLFSAKPLLSYSFAVAAFVFFAAAVWLAVNSSPHFSHTNEIASINAPIKAEMHKSVSDAQIEEQKPVLETDTKSAADIQNETVKNKAISTENMPRIKSHQSLSKEQNEPRDKFKAIISTIILPLGLVRGTESSTKTFEIPAKANFVNLQLKFEENDFSSYFAVLETVEGHQVWTGKILKSAKSKNEKVVTITIPSHLLKKSDYIISLKGLTKKGTYEGVGDYSFSIAR